MTTGIYNEREMKFRLIRKEGDHLTYKVTLKDLFLGSTYIHLEDYYLSEFTGLKDKNGKEIYEGDILKHDLWGKTTIIWEHGMFRGTDFEENGTELVEFMFSTGAIVTLADHQLSRCKIIGNIYENPELLNEREIK